LLKTERELDSRFRGNDKEGEKHHHPSIPSSVEEGRKRKSPLPKTACAPFKHTPPLADSCAPLDRGDREN